MKDDKHQPLQLMSGGVNFTPFDISEFICDAKDKLKQCYIV